MNAPLSRSLASIDGAYAVYYLPPAHDSSDSTAKYVVVLRPGSKAGPVAALAEKLVSSIAADKTTPPVAVEIWTYRDPLEGSDFTYTMSGLFPGSLGFPDYRGVGVVAIVGRWDAKSATWIVGRSKPTTPVYDRMHR